MRVSWSTGAAAGRVPQGPWVDPVHCQHLHLCSTSTLHSSKQHRPRHSASPVRTRVVDKHLVVGARRQHAPGGAPPRIQRRGVAREHGQEVLGGHVLVGVVLGAGRGRGGRGSWGLGRSNCEQGVQPGLQASRGATSASSQRQLEHARPHHSQS